MRGFDAVRRMGARGVLGRLLAAGAALLVVACGGGAEEQSQGKQLGALNQKVTITFWEAMAGGALRPTLEKITNDFNHSQKHVTVNLQPYPDYGTLRTKTLAALAAGTPPTMAQCYENWAAKYTQSKALADLSPYIGAKDGLSKGDLDDIFPIFLRDGKLGGTQYMFPFNKSTSVLFANQTALQQAGISSLPTTWEQLFADARKLTTGGRWGMDASTSLEGVFESMVQDYGGSVLNADQTKATFNSDAGRRALQLWVDGVKNGSVHVIGPSAYDDADFGAGKAALSIGTIAGYSFKQKAVGDKFTMTTAQEPGGPKGAHPQIFGTNVCVFGKASQAEQQGAFQFVKYFTSKQVTTEWSQATQYVPVRQSAYKDMQGTYYKQNPNLEVAAKQLDHGVFAPNVPTWDEATTDIQNELFNAVTGKKSTKQALDDAADQVDQVLLRG
jgi:multiple sugar transport system substrate-binding protein